MSRRFEIYGHVLGIFYSYIKIILMTHTFADSSFIYERRPVSAVVQDGTECIRFRVIILADL